VLLCHWRWLAKVQCIEWPKTALGKGKDDVCPVNT